MRRVYSQGTKIVTLPSYLNLLCDNTLIPRPIVPLELQKKLIHFSQPVTSELKQNQ